MASAAERTSYSWYCKPRRNADATVSFLLISVAVGCCSGAAVTVLSSRGFVWSGRCDWAGKGGCCEDGASADGPAKEQTASTARAKARGARNPASKHLGRIGSLLCAESNTGGSANTTRHRYPVASRGFIQRTGRFHAWVWAFSGRFMIPAARRLHLQPQQRAPVRVKT